MNDTAVAWEALHMSERRWTTVRAEGTGWRHEGRARQAAFDQARREPASSLFGLLAGDAQDVETVDEWRLWLAPPDRARSEHQDGGQTTVRIVNRMSWVERTPAGTGSGLEPESGRRRLLHETLLAPAPILQEVELEATGRVRALGREAILVRAWPTSPHWAGRFAVRDLGVGADELELLVDVERGVILSAEARHQGAPFVVLALREIAFGESFPESTFSLDTDLSERQAPPHPARWVALGALHRHVSFPVFAPDPAPAPGPSAEVLSRQEALITYEAPDGSPQLWVGLTERALPSEEPAGVRRAGDLWVSEDDYAGVPRSSVRLELAGTHVRLESTVLGLDALIEIARSLMPLPTEPPSLVEV